MTHVSARCLSFGNSSTRHQPDNKRSRGTHPETARNGKTTYASPQNVMKLANVSRGGGGGGSRWFMDFPWLMWKYS